MTKKIPMGLVDLEFVEEMAVVLQNGIKHGRKANDWKNLKKNKVDEYRNKILRHLLAFDRSRQLSTKLIHLASIACDAMILSSIIKK